MLLHAQNFSSDHEHEKPHFLKPTTLPTPTLKKSATTGFSLFGHYHEGAPVHLPEHKDDDIGLTMNISASPPTNHLPIPITTASLANEEKKTVELNYGRNLIIPNCMWNFRNSSMDFLRFSPSTTILTSLFRYKLQKISISTVSRFCIQIFISSADYWFQI